MRLLTAAAFLLSVSGVLFSQTSNTVDAAAKTDQEQANQSPAAPPADSPAISSADSSRQLPEAVNTDISAAPGNDSTAAGPKNADAAAATRDSTLSKPADTASEQSAAKEASEATGVEPEHGTITVQTKPAGAQVILDEQSRGESPVTLEKLAPGKHVLVLKKAGYYLKKVTLNVPAGSNETITLELTKPAQLTVTSEPAGASVFADSVELGATPLKTRKLRPGRYDLIVTKEGYESVTKELALADQSDSMHVVLAPVDKPAADKPAEAKTEKPEKNKKVVNMVALGVFLTFSLVILLIELSETGE